MQVAKLKGVNSAFRGAGYGIWQRRGEPQDGHLKACHSDRAASAQARGWA